jgi:5-methyltetrahydrofolate--homocysteine methyltransferase
MGRINLRERIKKGLLLLDGAMGTQLIARGIEVGKCNDFLNIDSPDTIIGIHKDYFEAGSDAVLTNTFGANRYALARHGLSEELIKINTTGAQIARKAGGEEKYVLGDIGPSGDFLQPLGTLKPDELKNAFAEQAKVLLAGGVDGVIIETMTSLDEITIAIEAVKSVCELPVFASMAFDGGGDDFRTMMGIDVKTAVSRIVSLGVDAIGFNCGKMSLKNYIKLAAKYVSATESSEEDIVLLAEPNAGLPELVEGHAVYKVSPADFAAAVEKIHSAGVNIIGGCCGTGPAHIEAAAKKLK